MDEDNRNKMIQRLVKQNRSFKQVNNTLFKQCKEKASDDVANMILNAILAYQIGMYKLNCAVNCTLQKFITKEKSCSGTAIPKATHAKIFYPQYIIISNKSQGLKIKKQGEHYGN